MSFLPKNLGMKLTGINDIDKKLQIAYSQINEIDWDKLQRQINNSIQQINIKDISDEIRSKLKAQQRAGLSELRKAQLEFRITSATALKKATKLIPELLKTVITNDKISLLLLKLQEQKSIKFQQ